MRLVGARLFALLVLVAAPVRAQQQPLPPVAFKQGFITVRAESAIGPEKGQEVFQRVWGAYDFVRRTQQWKNDQPLFAPLQVRVLANPPPGLLGEARGHDTFVVGLSFLDQPLSQGTLAHELTHIQDGRQLGRLGTGKLPHYLLEGRALLVGHSYRVSLNLSDHAYDKSVANLLAKVTPEDARFEITDDAFVPEGQMQHRFRMECVGLLFVEWLRTRAGGRGFADVQPRISKIVEEVGTGQRFELAFARWFGMPLQTAQQQFVAYLQQTAGNPAARFANTVPGLYYGH